MKRPRNTHSQPDAAPPLPLAPQKGGWTGSVLGYGATLAGVLACIAAGFVVREESSPTRTAVSLASLGGATACFVVGFRTLRREASSVSDAAPPADRR